MCAGMREARSAEDPKGRAPAKGRTPRLCLMKGPSVSCDEQKTICLWAPESTDFGSAFSSTCVGYFEAMPRNLSPVVSGPLQLLIDSRGLRSFSIAAAAMSHSLMVAQFAMRRIGSVAQTAGTRADHWFGHG